ncbi:hypothetical protein BCR37DRAFT_381427 [Protomyces lactucae-debilis]|uniref:Uncharacterized protein n=1 Tax=Protomyces lactucae-debilis TaxID=2754530 RepID=A0A1Y2F7X6_PROLT|nr:uncharacterized protein BCR37DRAFT_381427 [Protomyces lactucae-debilis]ORY79991.1 hypothetical protein BCR37DRAFT_381427 [Protomyces lactucae-debilis]
MVRKRLLVCSTAAALYTSKYEKMRFSVPAGSVCSDRFVVRSRTILHRRRLAKLDHFLICASLIQDSACTWRQCIITNLPQVA